MKTLGEILKEAENLFVESVKRGNFVVVKRGEHMVYLQIPEGEVCVWCSTLGWEYYQIYGETLRFPISDETKKILYKIFGGERDKLIARLGEIESEREKIKERLKNIEKCDIIEES